MKNYLDTNRYEFPINIIRTKRMGPALARNRGAQAAKGELLFWIDDDCIPHERWIESYIKLFTETGADILGGRLLNLFGTNLPAVIYHRLLDEFFDQKGGSEFLLTANLACRKNVFDELAGFDTRFFHGGEDREFILRANKKGFKVLFTEDNAVRHYHNFTHTGLWRHTFMQSMGSYLLYNIIKKELAVTLKPMSSKSYFGIMTSFIRSQGVVKGIIAVFSFIIMQLSAVTGYILAYLKLRRSNG